MTSGTVTWRHLIEVERRLGVDAFDTHPQEAISLVAWMASGTDLPLEEWLDGTPVSEIAERIAAVTGDMAKLDPDPGDELDPTTAPVASGS